MKRKIISVLLCLCVLWSMVPVSAFALPLLSDKVTSVTENTAQLLLPEDKKLVGFQQESDKAWVLENLSESDSRYQYLQTLKSTYGYTDRELLYLYPATPLSAEITYYTDEAMTQMTTAANGATAEGGVPNVVGTYYRKAAFSGGTWHELVKTETVNDGGAYKTQNYYEDHTYPAVEVSSAFYVVDHLVGGTRRGFSLSLIQTGFSTASGQVRGVNVPVASVDEGWSWTPASGSTPASLTLNNFHEERRQTGVPIAQRAAAFSETGNDYQNGASTYSGQFTIAEKAAHNSSALLTSMEKRAALFLALTKKEQELGWGLVLPGDEQVEISLSGTNQIGASGDPGSILVPDYELASLDELLSLLTKNSDGTYQKDSRVRILGMEDKSLLLTGSGTLETSSNILSPAGVTVGSGVTLTAGGSIDTSRFGSVYRSTDFKPESVMSSITYQNSTANPSDITVNLQGRVNISTTGSGGIYSTGKLTASGAKLSVTQSASGASALGAAYDVNLQDSTVTLTGAGGSGAAVEASENLSVANTTLTASGYGYGLAVRGASTSDQTPASLTLAGGTTSVTAGTAAVYASDADIVTNGAPNTDGVAVALTDLYGTLTGGTYAVCAYTQNTSAPVRSITVSPSSRANTVSPVSVPIGTVTDAGNPVAAVLASSGSTSAAAVLSATYVSNSSGSSSSSSTPAAVTKPAQTATPVTFSDVSTDAWYYDAVQHVVEKGLLVGVSSDSFAPDRTMDRAMMVVLLYRLAGQPETAGSAPFSDADSGAYYARALAWAYQKGIVLGNADGTFAAHTAVSRQQLIAFLYRYTNPSVKGSASTLSGFTDVSGVAGYAQSAMAWAVETGIVKGSADKALDPAALATRAQCAAFILRYDTAADSSKS